MMHNHQIREPTLTANSREELFKEELIDLLSEHEIEFDEKYLL